MKYQSSLISSLGAVLLCVNGTTQAAHEHHDMDRADAHAPVGVMGDHMHEEGGWMFSYRFMNMHMDGMRSGTDDISADEVATMPNALAGEMMRMGNMPDGSPRMMMVPPTYRISPIDMDMQMHMFGAMYGYSDKVTLMAMVNYVYKDMKLQTYRGPVGTDVVGRFNTTTSGIGDIQVGGLFKLSEGPVHNLHWNLALSLPTGSIREDGAVLPPFAGMMTPAGEKVDIDRLGYPMQLGSGSFDLLPGITYAGRKGDLTWGGQLKATIRLHENSENYRLGDIVEGTAWLAHSWAPWISTSARIAARSEGNIRGRDEVITGGMPLSDPDNSGRDQVDLILGVNMLAQEGMFKGHRLAFEVGGPVYEDVEGIQMSNDWSATIGWQKAF